MYVKFFCCLVDITVFEGYSVCKGLLNCTSELERVIVQKFNVGRMGALKFEWPCLSARDYKWKSIFNTMLQHKLLKMKYNSGTSSFSQRNDLKCEMIEHQISPDWHLFSVKTPSFTLKYRSMEIVHTI